MIREASSFEPPIETTGAESEHCLHRDQAQTPQNELTDFESRESEISRLTWAVLDGSASVEERGRLADLVGDQHKRRRR